MSALPWLDPDYLWFPPAEEALEEPDGLLALGGDLAPERLLHAYRNGIFPWFSDEQPILWWSPDPRCVIFPGQVHVSRSLRRTLNQKLFTITLDQAFRRVIHLCGSTRVEGTWITNEMEQAYVELHRQGHAHSVEAWNNRGELVGGLYGLALGRCFFAESMFSLETNASKVILVHLSSQLARWNYRVIDCQVESRHLLRMGARTIPRSDFLTILRDNVDQSPKPHLWQLDWHWQPPEGKRS
ncbi:leucyl/phenylalanyl-tRNA--protein transferase [Marinobacter daqiaonensis]|uniref:Leucyl/phenylalanyl-tRNA--protein transferase n=1 Tax=Marinobacter daqiaonensis TaxID=650891 RepID=A0A1I6H299_9GAMM|nr:leucyl/phenylalanyl-tRNA--protein transferase [Marinobacter daqiaonensis]SFR48471.1 leucyl/phenylalanyl-tRNA--protein transferase [Marinobacter daqiaonensis]